MHSLPVSFNLLTYGGFWRPENWPFNSMKYRMYNCYTVLMTLILYTYTLVGVIEGFLSEDINGMVDKLSQFISILGVCFKVATLLFRRNQIIEVVDILIRENRIPRDEEETNIRRKFDEYARKLTIYCEVLNESTVFFAAFAEINRFFRERTLPVYDWLTTKFSTTNAFVIPLLIKTVGLVSCANASVAHESLISGLMIQTYAQLDVLCHRTRSLPILLRKAQQGSKTSQDFEEKEKSMISDLVRYHLDIFDFAVSVNTVFNAMILMQFAISSTVLCLSVYRMSTTDLFSVEFIHCLTYLACMLMQVYLYCWFGNEVTLKSMKVGDAVYEMDWTILPVRVMKDLLIIMARSLKPIKMSSGHIVVLSAESFMSIMKASYSSYNLLKDTSN